MARIKPSPIVKCPRIMIRNKTHLARRRFRLSESIHLWRSFFRDDLVCHRRRVMRRNSWDNRGHVVKVLLAKWPRLMIWHASHFGGLLPYLAFESGLKVCRGVARPLQILKSGRLEKLMADACLIKPGYSFFVRVCIVPNRPDSDIHWVSLTEPKRILLDCNCRAWQCQQDPVSDWQWDPYSQHWISLTGYPFVISTLAFLYYRFYLVADQLASGEMTYKKAESSATFHLALLICTWLPFAPLVFIPWHWVIWSMSCCITSAQQEIAFICICQGTENPRMSKSVPALVSSAKIWDH